MNAHDTTGLFLSIAIHTSALLLFNQHASHRIDTPPETKVLTVELFSIEAPIKKQTNHFFSSGKTVSKDATEKQRPEISDPSGRTNILRAVNKMAPVSRKNPSQPFPLLWEESKSVPENTSQKIKTKHAKLVNKQRSQTRQQTQSLMENQRVTRLKDARPEPAASKSQNFSAKPAAITATRPTGLASNLPPIYPKLARRRGIEGTVVIMAEISPSGLVSSTSIKTSSGSNTLDTAAIRAIRDWRFTPATNNGSPITSEVEIPLTFKIK